MRLVKGPLWFVASVGHWIKEHFFLSTFTPEQQPKVKQSLAAVYIGMAVFLPFMYFNFGLWGLVKHWFIPCFLGMHFWVISIVIILFIYFFQS